MSARVDVAALAEMLGGGPGNGPIRRCFDLMEVAEDEIARAGGRKGTRAWDAFQWLEPGILSEFGNELYRAHCRELIARHVEGADMRPGTKAECVAVLSRMSLAAPPTRDYAALYGRLFAELFPTHVLAKRDLDPGSWPGATQEIERALVRKLSRERRTAPTVAEVL